MKLRKIFAVICFLCASGLAYADMSAYPDQPVYLGFYEFEVNEGVEALDKAKMRLPFVSHEGQWQAMPQLSKEPDMENLRSKYPPTMTFWTIENEPKSIEVNLPTAWDLSWQIGTYQITHPLGLELLHTNDAEGLSTWATGSMPPPLAILSKKTTIGLTIIDQEPLNQQEVSRLLEALKIELPHYDFCKAGEDEGTPKEWHKSNVNFGKVWRSGGATLVSLNLSKELNTCESVEGYKNDRGEVTCQFCDHWFLLRDNKTEFLGRALTYIDHGDYNFDKSDEWVFWLSGYNLDGYVLFSDDFRKNTQFTWSYH